MHQTAHDAARRAAVAELTTAEARTVVGAELAAWHGSFTINVTTTSGASNDVSVAVSIPLTDVTFLDPLGLFTSGNISVAATMRQEL